MVNFNTYHICLSTTEFCDSIETFEATIGRFVRLDSQINLVGKSCYFQLHKLYSFSHYMSQENKKT